MNKIDENVIYIYMFSEDIGLCQLCFPLTAYYPSYLNHILISRLTVKKFLAGEVSLN